MNFRNTCLWLLSIFLILGIFSCTQEDDCYVPRSVYAKFGFKSRDSLINYDVNGRDSSKLIIADTPLYYPSFSSKGTPQDIKIMADANRAIYMSVPLNPDADSINYLFQPNSDTPIIDSITIFYSHKYHFISNNCGYTYYYNIDSLKYSKLIIDSIGINKSEITQNATDQNLYLFFYKR